MSTTAEPELILHHYPLSPYAQKIRAMLGYGGVAWQSVITSEAPPRPHIETLVGGYRRIPVAQIGADIFCDSKTIAHEIARISEQPKLSPANATTASQQWIDAAEGRMFFATVLSSIGPVFLIKAIKQVSFNGMKALAKDRAEMGKTATIKAPGKKEAKDMVIDHLGKIERQLKQDFLLGDQPELADYAVYHGLWMIHIQGRKRFIRKFPKTVAWIERLQSLCKPAAAELSPPESLAAALRASPREIAEEHKKDALIGQQVSIGPSDYAQDATQGTLVGSTDLSWIIARETAETGLVHVHFPKTGYAITSN